ncbi:MAG: hypothetical protein LBT20_03925 [Clostridiales bacterium]|nr:hypothetical protein [Clostridiales bacterium]
MIVNPKTVIRDVYAFVEEQRARGYETGIIGRTVLGSPIPYVKKGDGRYGESMIFGAIHAREYITASLVVKMAKEYKGKSAIYFVPIVDIDGVALVTFGLDAIRAIVRRRPQVLDPSNPCFFYRWYGTGEEPPRCRFEGKNGNLFGTGNGFGIGAENALGGSVAGGKSTGEVADGRVYTGDRGGIAAELERVNGGSADFSLWKANIRAVDLNVNFDADWGTGASNVTFPSPANYIGPYPESERETKALVNFTKRHDFLCVLCYHCKGEVIYYGYKNNFPYPEYARLFQTATGYPLTESTGSAGGYKDWFTEQFDRLSLTVEVGNEILSYTALNEDFDGIYERNRGVAGVVDEIALKLKVES